MYLSKPQLSRFWRLWSRAEREALPASATKEERAELRRRTIREACGCESLTLVKRGAEYDRLMVATALLANDYEEAAHFSIGNERRLAKLMVECARQIGEIVGAPHGWDYCRETLAQANLPSHLGRRSRGTPRSYTRDARHPPPEATPARGGR